ncbi:MAG TPA: type II secretion system F family protein [Candidatus Omnitrophota bacterium]|nr:type II secretion system F family protein [Candidatus Omnitrophota bacterium]
MPNYLYRARDHEGRPVTGAMESISAEKLAEKLRELGYMPTQIKEALPNVDLDHFSKRFQRIKPEDLILFNVQLANMIDAGLTLINSLQIIHRQIENRKLRVVIEEVKRAVEGGSTFSDALSHHPKVFSKLFVDMVRAGETSGRLNAVLNRLANYVEQQEDLRQQVKNALFYPMILVIAGIAVVVMIVSFVMPKFIEVFNRAEVALPLPTQIFNAFGLAITHYWYVIIFIVWLAVMGIKMYARTQWGRWRLDRLKLDLPVVGSLVRKLIISRFSRTLATLVDSGVPILQSLDIVRDVVGNKVIAEVVKNVHNSVEEGEPIAKELKKSGEFPLDMVQMVSVGEETGKLAPMLDKIAGFYDNAVGYSLKKLIALIEPAFIIVLGILVGFIMASMLLPMFDMIKTIHR